MIDAIPSKSRQMVSNSKRAIYTRAKRLRGAIVVIPFIVTVLVSYIYLNWPHPPLWLQDLVVFSAPLLVGVIHYCRTWVYRYPVGAPLLGTALGGALFFPVVVAIHIGAYDVTDNGIGLAASVLVWAFSTYFIWRIFQPSTNMFWNTVLDRFRQDHRRWIVLAVVPLIWGIYAYGAFELADTQFDRGDGTLLRLPTPHGIACVTSRPGYLHAPWRQRTPCPPTQEQAPIR
jgi:hypothetical protein